MNTRLLIDNRNESDPRLNLALEEYILRNWCDGEYVLLYINDPSVILGKHQNVLEEVDPGYAGSRGIPVVRRISGGGAVYHDRGNLNFSVITDHDPGKHNNYDYFLTPVIAALRELGVETRLNNRNSLVLTDGRKISGNAQFASRGRMLSHGTLLFNADLDALEAVLRPVGAEIESHAVQSIRSRVVNLRDVIDRPMTIEELRTHMARRFVGTNDLPDGGAGRCLTEIEWSEVRRLAEEKYGSWEWNIGRSPRFIVRHRIGKGAESFDIELHVRDGIVRVAGSNSPRAAAMLETHLSSLIGERYEPDRVQAILAAVPAFSS